MRLKEETENHGWRQGLIVYVLVLGAFSGHKKVDNRSNFVSIARPIIGGQYGIPINT